MSSSVEFDFIILIIRKENEFLTRLEDISDKNCSSIKVNYGFSGEESFGPLPILAVARKFEKNESIFYRKSKNRFLPILAIVKKAGTLKLTGVKKSGKKMKRFFISLETMLNFPQN